MAYSPFFLHFLSLVNCRFLYSVRYSLGRWSAGLYARVAVLLLPQSVARSDCPTIDVTAFFEPQYLLFFAFCLQIALEDALPTYCRRVFRLFVINYGHIALHSIDSFAQMIIYWKLLYSKEVNKCSILHHD